MTQNPTWLDLQLGKPGPAGPPGAAGPDATLLAQLPFLADLAILGYGSAGPLTTGKRRLDTNTGSLSQSTSFTIPPDTSRAIVVYALARGATAGSWLGVLPPGIYERRGSANATVEFGSTPPDSGHGLLAGCSVSAALSGVADLVVTVTGPSSPVSWEVWCQLFDNTPSPPNPNAPTLTLISPSHGPATAPTFVTLSGTHLTGATLIRCGSTPVTTPVVTDTQITCTLPTGTGVQSISLVTPNGPASINYTFDPAPTISSLTPTTIPTTGGSQTINCTGLTNPVQVSVDGGTTFGAATYVNGTSATYNFPTHTAGTVINVVVKNVTDGQISNTLAATYAAADFDPTAFGSAGDLTFYSRGNLFHLDVNGNVDDTTNVASSPVDSFKNAGAITAHPAKNATGSANSKPSMTFDGVNDTLFTSLAAFSNYMATTDYTILAVLRYPTWPTNDSATSYLNKPGVVVAGGYTSIGARNKGGSTPVLVGGAYVGGDKYCETPAGQVAANTPFLATLTLHGGTLSIAAGMNAVGGSGSVACGAISAGSAALAIGANYAGGDFANVEIMCLIIYKNGNITGLTTLKQAITDFYQLAGHS